MRRIVKMTTAVAVATCALIMMAVPEAHAADQYSWAGCDVGWVCLYRTDAAWWSGQPDFQFYDYGYYNLDLPDYYYVFNNQFDNWAVFFCDGPNGQQCNWGYAPWINAAVDMSRFRSIYLRPF